LEFSCPPPLPSAFREYHIFQHWQLQPIAAGYLGFTCAQPRLTFGPVAHSKK